MFRHYLINLFRPYLVKVLNYGDIGIIWRQKTSKLLLLLNHFLQIPWPSHQPEASFLQFVLHLQGKVPYYIYIYIYIYIWVPFWKESKGRVLEDTKIEILWVLFSFLIFSFLFPLSIWAFAWRHWLVRARIVKESPHTCSPSSAFKLSTFQASKGNPNWRQSLACQAWSLLVSFAFSMSL